MPRLGRQRHIVHAGQETVPGADVAQHLDIERARELQPPVPLARPDALRQTLARVARLQGLGVEVLRLSHTDGQRHWTGVLTRVVPGVDAHLPIVVGTVDDPHKALVSVLPRPARRRRKQPDAMPQPHLRARRHRRIRALGRATRAGIKGKGVGRGRRVRRRRVHRVRHLRVRLLALDAPGLLVPGVANSRRLRRAAFPVQHSRAHRALCTQRLRNRRQDDRNEHCVHSNSARAGRHVRRRTRSPRCC